MVEILDSTLREGEQTPQVNFMIEEKLEIARLLDRIGVDMIEAGDPSVSPNVFQAVKRIAGLKLRAEIVAHSLATKSGIDHARDCGVQRVVVFYPTSKIHLEAKMHHSQDEAVAIVCEHIRYARSLGLKVRYTPEDASRTDFDFLVRVCNCGHRSRRGPHQLRRHAGHPPAARDVRAHHRSAPQPAALQDRPALPQ